MEITFNGKKFNGEKLTVARLLAAENIDPQAVIIERNGAAFPTPAIANQELAAGDEINAYRIVAGG